MGVEFQNFPKKGGSDFSHKKEGIVKTSEVVLEWGVHPGPNLGTLCIQHLDASLTSINGKTFFRSEKLQKHI